MKRDRATWYCYLMLGMFTYLLNIQGNIIPFLKTELGLSYRVVGLQGGGYQGSISVRRIIHHRNMAQHFRRLCSQYQKPDIIVASLTPLELARAAVEYGRHIGCPVIVDVRGPGLMVAAEFGSVWWASGRPFE